MVVSGAFPFGGLFPVVRSSFSETPSQLANLVNVPASGRFGDTPRSSRDRVAALRPLSAAASRTPSWFSRRLAFIRTEIRLSGVVGSMGSDYRKMLHTQDSFLVATVRAMGDGFNCATVTRKQMQYPFTRLAVLHGIVPIQRTLAFQPH